MQINFKTKFSEVPTPSKFGTYDEFCMKLGGLYYKDRIDRKIEEYAKITLSAFNTIKRIQADNYVVLGRDAWALVPLLWNHGLSVQYFVFSRIQIGCEKTRELWLKEVQPYSLIIDTGFNGSIFNAIQQFDRIQGGLLYASNTYVYPAVTTYDQNDIVDTIEHSNKMAAKRGRTISNNDNVIWSPKVDDNAEQNHSSLQKEWNFHLLCKCGLPEKVAESFCAYTGTTPKERLLKCGWERKEHYRKIGYLRGKYTPKLFECGDGQCGSERCHKCSEITKHYGLTGIGVFDLYDEKDVAIVRHGSYLGRY